MSDIFLGNFRIEILAYHIYLCVKYLLKEPNHVDHGAITGTGM